MWMLNISIYVETIRNWMCGGADDGAEFLSSVQPRRPTLLNPKYYKIFNSIESLTITCIGLFSLLCFRIQNNSSLGFWRLWKWNRLRGTSLWSSYTFPGQLLTSGTAFFNWLYCRFLYTKMVVCRVCNVYVGWSVCCWFLNNLWIVLDYAFSCAGFPHKDGPS